MSNGLESIFEVDPAISCDPLFKAAGTVSIMTLFFSYCMIRAAAEMYWILGRQRN